MELLHLLSLFSLSLSFSVVLSAPAAKSTTMSRTSPPDGCLVVKPSGSEPEAEFSSLDSAVASLGSKTTAACIFIYPGTYSGQNTINYAGPLTIYGSTPNSLDYQKNTVTLSHAVDSASAGTLDASSTLQVLGSNVKLYNINIENTYGKVGTYSQAVAVTANGDNLSFYGCRFISYQDTLYVKAGNQYFKNCYVEGAVDYIFGAANTWIGQSTLASKGPGYITASGRTSDDKSWFVIDSSGITAALGYTETGQVYLGRPWRKLARVLYQNSRLSNIINPAGWHPMEQGASPTFEEYNNSGDGSDVSQRQYESKTSSALSIGQVFPGNYCAWIDCNY